MAKFKVGDKVRVITKELSYANYGDIGIVIGYCEESEYPVRVDINNEEDFGFVEDELELYKEEYKAISVDGGGITVRDIYTNKRYKINSKGIEEVKEDKMKKTVKEVINEIKEGEVWLSESKVKCYLKNNTLNIDYDNEFTTNKLLLTLDTLLELERKEYTFEEAFKAYEEGKEIESVLTGDRFKLIDKDTTLMIDGVGIEMEHGNRIELFSVQGIRGKWYIND